MATSDGTPPPADTPKSTDDGPATDRTAAIHRLHDDQTRRAKSLRKRAWWYLALTFVLLGLAVLAIVSAPDLAESDVDTRLVSWQDRMNELRKEISLAEVELEGVERRIGDTEPTDFHDVAFDFDGDAAVAVGEDGAIRIARRDSRDWQPAPSGTLSDLHAVAFGKDGESGEVVVAAGARGTILVSTNNGRSWDTSRVDTEKDLNALAFGGGATGNTVIAVGDKGIIQVSGDAGRSWRRRESGTTSNLYAVAFIGDTRTAVAAGEDGALLVSDDGGGAWTVHGDVTTSDLRAVATHGPTAAVVVVGEDGTILVSRNGVRPWGVHETGERREDFEGVAISSDGGTAVAVGRRGVIRVSGGAFERWTDRSGVTRDRLNAVAIGADGRSAFAAGRDGTVLVSVDGGTSWERPASGLPNALNAIGVGEDGVVFVGDGSTILRAESSDGRVSGDFEVKIVSSGQLVEQDLANLKTERNTIRGKLKALGDRMTDEKVRGQAIAGGCTFDDEECVSRNSVSPWVFLLQTNSLRAAILVVLIFLSQHLITLARYDLRLAAFYLARGDALLLSDPDTLSWSNIEELERLIATLSPDGLDFGRSRA